MVASSPSLCQLSAVALASSPTSSNSGSSSPVISSESQPLGSDSLRDDTIITNTVSPTRASESCTQQYTMIVDTARSNARMNTTTTTISNGRMNNIIRQPNKSLFLIGLMGMLVLAMLLAVMFVPRDEHSPRRMQHPLSSIQQSQPQEEHSIRYLTFGSSSTWGQGLDDPTHEAFPWLLSPSVHNVAARVGGLSLAAICTQSIVGDRVYDVIVVEFMDDDADSVIHLATRLRLRFPSASLVFVRLWSPMTHIVYHINNNNKDNSDSDSDSDSDQALTLLGWWNQQQESKQLPLPSLISSFSSNDDGETNTSPAPLLANFEFHSALLNSDPLQWAFRDFSEQASAIDQAIVNVEGYLFNLPFPVNRNNNIISSDPIPLILTSQDYMSMFQPENAQFLSIAGHRLVAQGIQKLLQTIKNDDTQATTTSSAIATTAISTTVAANHHSNINEYDNILKRPHRNEVGSWGTGDSCTMWYASGDYSALRSRRRANLVDFSKSYDGVHKHAVEISRRGGSVVVTNPFDVPRMLYLTYMTAAAAAPNPGSSTTSSSIFAASAPVREYPRTKVSLGGKPMVLIDPIYDPTTTSSSTTFGAAASDMDGDDHLTRTTAVGLVPPGRTVLRLDSLDPSSTSRFRLVGLHLLNKGKVLIPFEFAMEPDSAHR